MKGSVVIIGAGGTGRELADLLTSDGDRKIHGFLDDRETGPHILGRTDMIATFAAGHPLAAAIGSYRSMQVRTQIISKVPEAAVFSWSHSRSSISGGSRLGAGHLVFPNSVISTGVVLGRHVLTKKEDLTSDQTMRVLAFA